MSNVFNMRDLHLKVGNCLKGIEHYGNKFLVWITNYFHYSRFINDIKKMDLHRAKYKSIGVAGNVGHISIR